MILPRKYLFIKKQYNNNGKKRMIEKKIISLEFNESELDILLVFLSITLES